VTIPVLFDTHALLWLLAGDKRLSTRARRIVVDSGTELVVSAVSLWEIVLKHQAGKLKLDVPLEDFVEAITSQESWRLLPVTPAHIRALCDLPRLHKDPFDRVLIAQTELENMILLTADSAITAYPVRTTW